MRTFALSTLVTIAALITSFYWAGVPGMMICFLLILIEVTFSCDNAIVNAVVLKDMDKKWRQRFLTWGMIVAVFGMRLLFPIAIVAFATGLHFWDVTKLAIDNPAEYTRHILSSHSQISAFGGMFLLMVFLQFTMNEHKQLHWIAFIENKLAKLGKLESFEAIVALAVLLAVQCFLPEEEQHAALVAGAIGIILYVLVNSATAMVGGGGYGKATVYSGLVGFIYLQFLDASFSLDGVIGAFAISNDIVIIMLGLGAGAMFVRSVTVYLVHKGTLEQYVFLEHGAHYGIGALAVIMLVGMIYPVPQVITGSIGLIFILLSLWSSVRYNRTLKA